MRARAAPDFEIKTYQAEPAVRFQRTVFLVNYHPRETELHLDGGAFAVMTHWSNVFIVLPVLEQLPSQLFDPIRMIAS